MSRCDDLLERLLAGADDAALEEHLRSCASCRRLQRGHRAALALRGAFPSQGRRIDSGKVARRLGAVAGLAASVALAAVLWPRPPPPAPAPVSTVTLEAPSYSEDDAVWTVFWAAHDAGLGAARPGDPVLLAFGALGPWVSPSSTPRPAAPSWPVTKED